MARNVPQELARLAQEIKTIKKGQRYAHGGSIENSALEIRDDLGGLRAIVGVQPDGTTAVNIVNGPPPPQPTVPALTSVLGGVTASWNGTFEGGATLPLDWQRMEVHASPTDGFTPVPETLQATIETPQGSTAVVITDVPVYVRLVARSTSGTASTPSGQAGPLGPQQVVADTILDGIVTEVKLANDAVTAAKIAAGAVGTSELADAAVHAQQLADAAVEVGKIANDAVTGPAIASEAVSAGKIAANAVTAVKIAANAVTAAKIAAGAITTDKLTVTGGANILTDPSFEGAYTASLVAGSAFATQDLTKGNGSPASIRIDATSATAAYRSVALTSVATMPGEQWHLAVDYWVSADWVGTEISIHARWDNAAGAVISYGKVLTATPVREGWTRLAGTVTAPAATNRATFRVESGNATAGLVWFDNAVVRPVLGGTQIQNGAITTEKVVAGGIEAGNIAAGAVQAGKIAAGAVTTEKLDALAVTADKIAANAITVGKLAAGSVDATALAADAITGKTITGGTVTGSILQTATSGERITINEAGNNKLFVYDGSTKANGSPRVVASFTPGGVGLTGPTGNIIAISPATTYPSIRWTTEAEDKWARVQVVTSADGDLDLELLNSTGNDVYMGKNFTNMTSRLRLLPGLDTNSALYAEVPAEYAGHLARFLRDGIYRFSVDKDGNTDIGGILTAGNIVTGTATVTPSAAHVPTSTSVSYPALKGTTFRGYATANSTVPGVRTPAGAQGVTGVAVSSVTSTGMLVWVNRENTTPTNINWMVIAS